MPKFKFLGIKMKKVYLVKSKLFSERKKDSNFHHKIITFTLSLFVIIASFTISSLAATEWTGNTSSDWGESTNWNGTPPGPSTTDVDILIKSGLSTYPVLSSGTYSIKGLSIESGATLTQSGGTLTVNDDFNLSSGSPGGVYNQSGGTLQLKKSFKNDGAFNSTGGTVQFSAGANSGNFDGTNQFFHLTIDASVVPNFDGGSYNISVAGNYLNNNSSLDITTAVFTFNGTSDQTISSTSTPLPATTTFGNLVIDKPSGTIQLLSDVAVENTFTETNGTLDENGYVLWVNGSPLPVELSSFSAVILENRIKLKWRTETEVSNYGFEIERTLSDSQNLIWGKIGFVEGHGNSNSPKEYNFIDKTTWQWH